MKNIEKDRPKITIQKIYTKDVSFEAPNAPIILESGNKFKKCCGFVKKRIQYATWCLCYVLNVAWI